MENAQPTVKTGDTLRIKPMATVSGLSEYWLVESVVDGSVSAKMLAHGEQPVSNFSLKMLACGVRDGDVLVFQTGGTHQ